MIRHAFAVLVCLTAVPLAVRADDWAPKMFNTTSHDFGPVASGSKAQFRFQIKNVYEEDVHIMGVRSSCNCTVPTLSKTDLKTYQTADLVATFNTRDFRGHRTATLTVTFDKPYPAEVQLNISGFIRTDVMLQPGAIDWGSVDLGKSVEKKLIVTHTGREDWKIVDVKTADPHFEVEVHDPLRAPGKVTYELLVRLTSDAPVGYIKDQLILVTNDTQGRELPVDMEGRVVPEITIAPPKLFIGVVQPGQKVTKNLVIRGKKPFRITDVECADKSFTIEPSKEAKVVHLVPVVFVAGDDPGRIAQKIRIHTDQGEKVVQTFTAFAEVVKPGVASTQRAKAVSEETNQGETP